MESKNNQLKQSLKDTNVSHLSLHNYKGFIRPNKENLYDVIMKQVDASSFNPDKEICEYLLLQLNENGFFSNDYKTIINKSKFPAEAVKKTLALLRTFTPQGLFSFSDKDCLQIQCILSKEEISETAFLLCDYLDEIRLQKYSFIMRKCKVSHSYIMSAIQFLEQLNITPTANYIHNTQMQQPTFIITYEDDNLQLIYNEKDGSTSVLPIETMSRDLKIKYFRKPICLVMIYLCHYQKTFFTNHDNISYLTLAMISKETNLHLSTIAKLIQHKTYSYQNKIHALKTLTNANGTKEASAQVIKQHIINYVKEEDKAHPLSDAQIQAKLLDEYQITIARRTIVKYRESCFIFNSNKRRNKKSDN